MNAFIHNENSNLKRVLRSANLGSDNFDMSFEIKRYIKNGNEITTIGKTIEVNLNTRDDPQTVLLELSLDKEEFDQLIAW